MHQKKSYVNTRKVIAALTFMAIHLSTWGHSMWNQRNEVGDWTVALYHCDEEITAQDFFLFNAGDDSGLLDLMLHSDIDDPLESVSAKAWYLNRAVAGSAPCQLLSKSEAMHPPGDMSIEIWMKMLDGETDIQVGFVEGISLRIRFNPHGDLFHLLGRNSNGIDDITHSAPGFESFPRFSVWNHYGVTIHAPNVEKVSESLYRYGEGCVARFFFNSHAVGFIDNRILPLEGLTFVPSSKILIHIREGGLIFDEMQISRVDWTDPMGHGGESHGSIAIEHAFENGRIPTVNISDWSMY